MKNIYMIIVISIFQESSQGSGNVDMVHQRKDTKYLPGPHKGHNVPQNIFRTEYGKSTPADSWCQI